MKIRNTKNYTDKETRAPQKAGGIRDVTAKRGREIIARGCAEEVREPGATVVGE